MIDRIWVCTKCETHCIERKPFKCDCEGEPIEYERVKSKYEKAKAEIRRQLSCRYCVNIGQKCAAMSCRWVWNGSTEGYVI